MTLSKIKSRLIRFRPAQPPVVLLGARRGGTTMAAGAMANQPGVWFADEPFAVYPNRSRYALRARMLPQAMHSQFFDLGGSDLDAFETYARALLAARLPGIGTARFTKPLLRADRVALKVLNAPWMAEWFRDRTDAWPLVLLRHPGAQAVSVLRQNWGFGLEAYLARPESLEARFTAAQIDAVRAAWDSEDRWRIAVADWIVMTAPLRALRGPRVLQTRYEGIVRDPVAFVDDVLIGTLGFDGAAGSRQRMLDALLNPSESSGMSTEAGRARIAARDVDALIDSWRGRVSEEQHGQGQALLDAFEIDEYRFGLDRGPARDDGDGEDDDRPETLAA